MEQPPSQDKNSAEAGLLREALPFAPGARHGPEHMQPGHDTSLNPFHRPEPYGRWREEGDARAAGGNHEQTAAVHGHADGGG